jgi:diguanylate cyclase (GGDEF)-like protein
MTPQTEPHHRLVRLLFGADPKLHRMMQYWAATAALYGFFIFLFYDGRFERAPHTVDGLALYTACGTAAFYLLVRANRVLGLAPTTLAVVQGIFGITCNMWAYSITGPLRGATLMGLMVVVVFCTFALRPRQTLVLAFGGLAGIGATMWWQQAHDPAHYPPAVEGLTFAIMAACSLAVTFLTGEMTKLRTRLTRQREELAAALDTIRTLATVDDLTSLANRRHMNELLAAEERRQSAGGRDAGACVALLDIDFFKQINDRHGHAAGDAVLRGFAQALRAGLRDGDRLARWGGEEFLLLLPDTVRTDACAVLERMRTQVAALTPPGVALERPLTFSAGLCAQRGGEAFAESINRADKALYEAKSSGRDRVVEA